MSQPNKKPCIQKRIKSWFSNLRFEQKLFLIVVGGMVFFYAYVYVFLQLIFLQFLAEFTAGFLGILIGFYLDRQNELRKRIGISKQIINSLLVELHYNLDLTRELKPDIMQGRKQGTILAFDLFQTSAWNTFSSRLEVDAIEILFELGAIYHRFELFNEAIKLEGVGNQLSTLLERKPKFLEQLEKDLEEIIKLLNNLRI